MRVSMLTAFSFMIIVLVGCSVPKQMMAQPTTVPHYNFNAPSHTFDMPSVLKEISGICLSADENMWYAVQDETASIYLIDAKSGAVQAIQSFGTKGDFEDIARVGNDVYVVKSDGTIAELKNFNSPQQIVTLYRTSLEKENDVEGLCYDSLQQRLLVACKGVTDAANKRSIYAFSLSAKTLSAQPVYTIDTDSLSLFVKGLDKDEQGTLRLGPSAIAIHPQTGELYVLSSVNKVLLILGSDGAIRHVEILDNSIHMQPEGITFRHDGGLYISNEGKKKNDYIGKVYYFEPMR